MRTRDSNEAAVILAGYTAWAAVNLLRGFSLASLPMLAVFTLLGMCMNTAMFPVLLGSALLGLISPVLMPWSLLVAGMLASATGGEIKIRVTGFLAVASTLWLIPVSLSIPLAIVSVASTVLGKKKLRYMLIPAGFIVSALVTGLPGPLTVEPVVAGSEISEGILSYHIPEVNTSRREVLLPAPFQGTWAVWIALEAGGVRDSIPMLAVRLGESMLLLPSGVDTLSFTMVPGDTLAVTLMKDFMPFNHSVIHATAGGERL
ncbi:MAG: hypothetical protein KAH54_02510 [Candidatus Sabulitectum sp.]|nr:hypothetical protein [Candidatus Sabulitectum sp.]